MGDMSRSGTDHLVESAMTPPSSATAATPSGPRLRLRRRWRLFGRDDRGTATMELAIVLPLLLMVMFGLVEFGIFFTQAVAVTNAAHNGARYAVVHPTSWSSAASP